MTPIKGPRGENFYSEEEIRRMSDSTMLSMAKDALNAMLKMGDRLEMALASESKQPTEGRK